MRNVDSRIKTWLFFALVFVLVLVVPPSSFEAFRFLLYDRYRDYGGQAVLVLENSVLKGPKASAWGFNARKFRCIRHTL
jgi:hypothetical protein